MATRKITFDPDAGVPVASNLTIYGGTDFSTKFNVVDVSNVGYGFTAGWSISSQMQKSTGVGATTIPTATFTAGIDTTTSSISVSLGATNTRSLAEGRYVYNVLVSPGIGTVYNIVNGNILVYSGISSAP